VIYPSPAQGKTRPLNIERAERDLKWFDRLVPGFRPIHPVSPELPRNAWRYESLLPKSRGSTPCSIYRIRALVRKTRSAPGLMRSISSFSQHLRRTIRSAVSSSKLPLILHSLEAIFAVYPDAQIVHTLSSPRYKLFLLWRTSPLF